jgi:hypothetical protein
MSSYWRKVDSKCVVCRSAVGKIVIKSGKIVVEEYFDNWGCWKKVPQQSEMQVLCRVCQKQTGKQQRKHRQNNLAQE